MPVSPSLQAGNPQDSSSRFVPAWIPAVREVPPAGLTAGPTGCWRYGEDGTRFELVRVQRQHRNTRRPLSRRGDPHEPDSPRVRPPVNDRELAEVLVQGKQDPTLTVSHCENVVVPGVRRPVAAPDHIVPGGLESRLRRDRNAGVEEDSQEPASYRRSLD